MLKLYKRIKAALHYLEAWAHGSKITEHWGSVGEHGQAKEHKRNKKLSEAEDLDLVYVVDFRIAKHVVEIDLKDTEFADFSQIYWEAVLLSSGSVRVFGSNKASLSRACVLSKTSACSRSARGRSSGRRKPSSSPIAARSTI